MDDWLHLFGKFDTVGTLGWYIPTNDKSLVVRIALPCNQVALYSLYIIRCRSYQQELSLALSSPHQWETSLVVNGVLLHRVSFSLSVLGCNWTPTGRCSSLDVSLPASVL